MFSPLQTRYKPLSSLCVCVTIKHTILQVNAQSVTEQIQALANPAVQGQHQGSLRLDTAVEALLLESQQGRLQGSFYGCLHSLAIVPAAVDSIAINAVLTELCNLVSTCCRHHYWHHTCCMTHCLPTLSTTSSSIPEDSLSGLIPDV